ncbi:methionyl aminopeptidase [Anseongella ginsenosidimutans]|uniref:Methionine aminopeptidase n=1 Tax=Anseongella ginsenosidimutans TaxID=496056 RepID=A0A4R3KMH5_9SPHI|nr:type I methionyl aminopeptidase [Anseongella ginsenosidimutans]QEC54039.1 type I methionyl aminopeptidase [Anseongella ginsenosidimutans]TCS85196.1 methionyl aminopeptidase [Anseongella ginsenosidimutans]
MIYYKTAEEIELIRKSSLLVSKTLAEIAGMIKPGITGIALDKRAEEFIRDHGAEPAFKGFNGFPYSLCISPNDKVVHGFPSEEELKEGDIISVDCGVAWNGFIGDSAYTFAVGAISEDLQTLLDVTKECLRRGVEKATAGNRVGDISYAVQEYAAQFNYGIVKELVGHGVGKELHEKPEIPNFGKRGSGPKLEEGMVIAIEPMINMGTARVKFWDDGWTVSTKDGKASAHFEHTVAIKKGKAEMLSTFECIEERIKQN